MYKLILIYGGLSPNELKRPYLGRYQKCSQPRFLIIVDGSASATSFPRQWPNCCNQAEIVRVYGNLMGNLSQLDTQTVAKRVCNHEWVPIPMVDREPFCAATGNDRTRFTWAAIWCDWRPLKHLQVRARLSATNIKHVLGYAGLVLIL